MVYPTIMGSGGDITLLLEQWGNGDRRALDQLMPLVYEELKRIAGGYLNGEHAGHTLQPTALVHEGYLRLVQYRAPKLENRKHFLVVAAQALRRVLVDHARRRDARKRDVSRMPLDSPLVIQPDQHFDVVLLDDALSRLAVMDPQKAQIVELRFFGGLSTPETAAATGLSPARVKREWAVAKAWLYRELRGDPSGDSAAMA